MRRVIGRVGELTIAPGLEAELVVLGRSPLGELEALRDKGMIMNDGKTFATPALGVDISGTQGKASRIRRSPLPDTQAGIAPYFTS